MLFFVLTFIFLLISILLSIYGLLFTSPKFASFKDNKKEPFRAI